MADLQVVDDKLQAANEETKRLFANAQSVSTILGYLSRVEVRLQHVEALLRAIDFLQGLHKEYTAVLVAAGVLAESKQPEVAQAK